MNPNPASSILIIGVGNEQRGDDGAGLAVVRLIRARALPCQVVETTGDGTALIDWLRSFAPQTVYLIDAMLSGQPSGSVMRFDVRWQPLPAALRGSSSHLFGVAHAIELARVLGDLPPKLIVYGIEGCHFDVGAGLSPEVEAGVRVTVERVIAECEMRQTHVM